MRHEDIANLKLTAISNWHNYETIRKFLAENMLEGDGDHQGQRLRIDMCRASGAPKACRRGRPSKRITSGASAGSTDSTPAPMLHATSAPSAAPLRVSLRTRIQIFVCGPYSQMNLAAAAAARRGGGAAGFAQFSRISPVGCPRTWSACARQRVRSDTLRSYY